MSKANDVPPVAPRWWPYQEALVYRLAVRADHPLEAPAMPGLSWGYLDPASIERHFADQPALKRRFLRFHRQGAVGVVIRHGRTWLTYAWMATPEGRQPYHLPAVAQGRYWIFECHTRPAVRGHGLFGYALRLLLNEAFCREQFQAAEVFADVMPDNAASRRAFWRRGFEPAGKFATWRLPKSTAVKGTWDPAAAHDAMPLPYPRSS